MLFGAAAVSDIFHSSSPQTRVINFRNADDMKLAEGFAINLAWEESDLLRFPELKKDVVKKTIRKLLTEENTKGVFATLNGEPVGMGILHSETHLPQDTRVISYVYVNRSSRGKNAGHQIIQSLLEQARNDNDIKKVLLLVRNRRNLDFYKQFGFAEFNRNGNDSSALEHSWQNNARAYFLKSAGPDCTYFMYYNIPQE